MSDKMRERYIVNGKRPLCPQSIVDKCYQGTIVAARIQFDEQRPWSTLQCEKCGHMFDRLEIDASNVVEWVDD